MTHTNTENVILDSYAKIELLVTYDYEQVTQIEDFHGRQELVHYDIDINNVELVIAGQVVNVGGKSNLFPYLTGKQLNEIQSELQIH
jgi:hypothetical protein